MHALSAAAAGCFIITVTAKCRMFHGRNLYHKLIEMQNEYCGFLSGMNRTSALFSVLLGVRIMEQRAERFCHYHETTYLRGGMICSIVPIGNYRCQGE